MNNNGLRYNTKENKYSNKILDTQSNEKLKKDLEELYTLSDNLNPNVMPISEIFDKPYLLAEYKCPQQENIRIGKTNFYINIVSNEATTHESKYTIMSFFHVKNNNQKVSIQNSDLAVVVVKDLCACYNYDFYYQNSIDDMINIPKIFNNSFVKINELPRQIQLAFYDERNKDIAEQIEEKEKAEKRRYEEMRNSNKFSYKVKTFVKNKLHY